MCLFTYITIDIDETCNRRKDICFHSHTSLVTLPEKKEREVIHKANDSTVHNKSHAYKHNGGIQAASEPICRAELAQNLSDDLLLVDIYSYTKECILF